MNTIGPFRDTSTSPPLQRGKACLSCRRRKMKCDGARPTCTQCIRGDRADDCEYTDGNRRPRMLALEEEIARLKARVQELENPQNTTPSIELHTPYTSLATPSPSLPQAPYPASMVLPSATSNPATSSTDSSWGFDGPPQQNVQQSLTVLAPHAAELGLFLNIDRLRAQSPRIFPALHSTLALWSVHLSQPHLDVSEQDLEPALLSHALHQVSSALSTASSAQDPQVFMHIIQAEVLLSLYLQCSGQSLGARYHASAALSLALGLRLHAKPGEAQSTHLFDFLGNSYPQLPPPTDAAEEKERVDAFWTVYSLDRCLGAFYNEPSGMNGEIMVTAPWPSSHWPNEATQPFLSTGSDRDRLLTSAYNYRGQSSFMTSTTDVTSVNTVSQFLTGHDRDITNDSPLGLQAKASVLLGEATSISASYAADRAISQSPAFWSRFATLDNLIQWFSASLPPPSSIIIASGIIQPPNARQTLLTINLTALAQITLHRTLAQTHAPSDRRCIEGALRAAHTLDGVSDPGLVSPVCAIIWTALSLVLHDEVLRLRAQRSQASSPAPSPQTSNHEEEAEIFHATRNIFSIMSELSVRCPAKAFTAKSEALLPILSSIDI
ncbi:hypothetical protein BS17DRAFT_525067 [Gyrodon lividus]|nr:hypothetical protein BS17DRAFT_525067 [Gyrodon lividus]